ncbi:peptidase C1-like family-domain-containing protein [Pseudoneurospora amorphoporcata]|uniref:Cysteine proteinase 1, mitochondrial n=1 Tax=Pseudoneurospora amorphoporcata TaxID=241081 RepID=A0AAN6NR66_9PEZI|nr:peptidase C1-like family-domain-containing protein [Pseudoneurospora amorphoporcata]
MGASQSKIPFEEKAVNSTDDDYVHVENELTGEKGATITDIAKSHPKNRLALSALSAANPRDVILSRAAKIAEQQVFNIKIPFEGSPITNQRQSGRCWLFASTNLEKSNWFLEQIISTADQDLDSCLVQRLLHEPLSDGGQWDMVYNLVDKYGLVPQSLYPDSFNASSSSVINSIIFTKLCEYALVLRKLLSSSNFTTATEKEQTLSTTKAKMMKEIHAILTLTLGPPPPATSEFTWSFIDRHGKARTVRSTPQAFAQDIYSTSGGPLRITGGAASGTIARMVSLVHDPRHPPLTLMTVDMTDWVTSSAGATLLISTLTWLASKRRVDRVAGLMDLDLIDYELGFNVGLLGADKASRLRTGDSLMTHAMVLTAVHVDEETGKTVRWRVQNSWGTAVGEQGWFVMSDAWMGEFVYQAVVDVNFLGRDVKEVLGQEPVVLPLWDPMGSLAGVCLWSVAEWSFWV